MCGWFSLITENFGLCSYSLSASRWWYRTHTHSFSCPRSCSVPNSIYNNIKGYASPLLLCGMCAASSHLNVRAFSFGRGIFALPAMVKLIHVRSSFYFFFAANALDRTRTHNEYYYFVCKIVRRRVYVCVRLHPHAFARRPRPAGGWESCETCVRLPMIMENSLSTQTRIRVWAHRANGSGDMRWMMLHLFIPVSPHPPCYFLFSMQITVENTFDYFQFSQNQRWR